MKNDDPYKPQFPRGLDMVTAAGTQLQEVLPIPDAGMPLIEGSWIRYATQFVSTESGTFRSDVEYVFATKLDESGVAARFEGLGLETKILVLNEGSTIDTLGVTTYVLTATRDVAGADAQDLIDEAISSRFISETRATAVRSLGEVKSVSYNLEDSLSVSGVTSFAELKEAHDAVLDLASVPQGEASVHPYISQSNLNAVTYMRCDDGFVDDTCFGVSNEWARILTGLQLSLHDGVVSFSSDASAGATYVI